MSKADLHIALPEKDDLDSRFGFVNDTNLKERLCLAMEYVIFLVQLSEKYKLNPTILFSIHKDIVLQTSCIVEACLHHTLKRIQLHGSESEKNALKRKEKRYTKVRRYYEISSSEYVVSAIETSQEYQLGDEEKFNELLKYAKRVNLLNGELETKAHDLRKKRNEIHLFALDDAKIAYEKETIIKVFEDTKDVLQSLEERLIRLNAATART